MAGGWGNPSDISLRPLRGLQSGSVSPSRQLTVGTPPLPPMLRSGYPWPTYTQGALMPDHWGYVFLAYGIAAATFLVYWRRLSRRIRDAERRKGMRRG